MAPWSRFHPIGGYNNLLNFALRTDFSSSKLLELQTKTQYAYLLVNGSSCLMLAQEGIDRMTVIHYANKYAILIRSATFQSSNWLDLVPDLIHNEHCGSAGNRTRDLMVCSHER